MAVIFPSSPVDGQTYTVGVTVYRYSSSKGVWNAQTVSANSIYLPGALEGYVYTSSNGQTTFSGADNFGKTLSYNTSDKVQVYLNGVKLIGNTDYTATSGSTVVMSDGVAANDAIDIVTIQAASSGSSSGGGLLWDGVTNFYSNTTPAVDTDPTANGALWVDYTTGAIYICTNNTSGNNVWTVTSSLATTVEPTPPWSFQGSNYGYVSGGYSGGFLTSIDKFPFSTDANATDVGDMTVARYFAAGQSSADYGYTSSGNASPLTNVIDKFPFANDGTGSVIGYLTVSRQYIAGQSSSEYGYTSGGYLPGSTNIIDKFPFSTDANATDVGDLTVARFGPAGQSSPDYGYSSGGHNSNVIDKFPFATDANATDVGDLTVARRYSAGQSSETYGYASGGTGPGGALSNVIDKFPFATDANATDVGDLTVARSSAAGQSSTDYGYSSGSDGATANIIDKFPFSSDANASDVGDLTVGRYAAAGQQY